jgi:outer membrane protein OmpA-like peptidoglycan-associated protein
MIRAINSGCDLSSFPDVADEFLKLPRWRRLLAAASMMAALAVGGCSDWYSDDSQLYTGPSGTVLPSSDSYPSLSTVPARPEPQSTAEERASALAETRPLSATAPQVAMQGAAPPAQPQPAGATSNVYAPGVPVNVAVINFAAGSANLNARDREVIAEVVALQKANGGTLTVVGHASQRTQPMEPERAAQINYDMSVQRARAVADALVAAGAPPEAVFVQAAGASQPVYAESMSTGEVGNQRADIFLTR